MGAGISVNRLTSRFGLSYHSFIRHGKRRKNEDSNLRLFGPGSRAWHTARGFRLCPLQPNPRAANPRRRTSQRRPTRPARRSRITRWRSGTRPSRTPRPRSTTRTGASIAWKGNWTANGNGWTRAPAREPGRRWTRCAANATKAAEWYGGLKHSSAESWEQVKTGFVKSYEVLKESFAKARKGF